ncbi:hypothetical protein OAY97_00365 [bacterium]|nr:hypothetical protein [bacterium]
MLKGGLKIKFDLSSIVDNLSNEEVEDLKNKLNYVGYSTNQDINELKTVVEIFVDDNNLENINNKEDLWKELINFGYKLGDRILSFNTKELYGSDVEELQELLSRMGYKEISEKFNLSPEEIGLLVGKSRAHVSNILRLTNLSDTVYEIRNLVRPGQEISLNEAMKSISPNLTTGTIGFNVCFDIPNLGSYKEQIKFYDQIKKSCINHGIISIFASEINEELNLENKIQYINNLQPTLFVSFNNSEEESVNFFKGRFSESVVGKKVAEHLSETLKIESIGRSSNILKETKSVGVVINGKFYQKLEIDNLIQSLVDSLKNQFEN